MAWTLCTVLYICKLLLYNFYIISGEYEWITPHNGQKPVSPLKKVGVWFFTTIILTGKTFSLHFLRRQYIPSSIPFVSFDFRCILCKNIIINIFFTYFWIVLYAVQQLRMIRSKCSHFETHNIQFVSKPPGHSFPTLSDTLKTLFLLFYNLIK